MGWWVNQDQSIASMLCKIWTRYFESGMIEFVFIVISFLNLFIIDCYFQFLYPIFIVISKDNRSLTIFSSSQELLSRMNKSNPLSTLIPKNRYVNYTWTSNWSVIEGKHNDSNKVSLEVVLNWICLISSNLLIKLHHFVFLSYLY